MDAERERYRNKMERRLGQAVTSQIQRHVEVALERYLADDLPNPQIMAMREFYELLAAEMAVQEIADRIEANAVFVDPDDGLLPTLGVSWRHDVQPFIDSQESPGYMSLENAEKFLRMVQMAEKEIDGRRKELIEFLERAVKLREAVWCEA